MIKTKHWWFELPYKLMYKKNTETGKNDIIKAYSNIAGNIVHIEIVGKG